MPETVDSEGDLVPPDHDRSQGEKPNPDYSPMNFVGNTKRFVRCRNDPIVIAVEIEPGPEGKRGAMSLCDECKAQLEEQQPGFAAYRSIREVKAHA